MNHSIENRSQRYLPFSVFLNRYFTYKVQKITIDAGFSCPNRDGNIGSGGCIYCNNRSFSPAFSADRHAVRQQMEDGKRFFMRKYPQMKYLAYFQAFTNTYAPLERLRRLYEEALSVENVVGIVVGTRPDCVSDELLHYLAALRRKCFVMMEYGVESTDDAVLRRIHRGHDYACAVSAVKRTAEAGIPVGIHLILGLPGTTRESLAGEAARVSALPVNIVKLHQLQIIKGTPLARMYQADPHCVDLFSVEDYVDVVVNFLEHLRPDIVVERFTSQSPAGLLLAPEWGLKNYQFVELVKKRLQQRDTWQGRLYNSADDCSADSIS